MGYITNKKNRSPETYPDPRGGALTVFARNFAVGPPPTQSPPAFTIPTTGLIVPWEVIDSLGGPGIALPITPRSTGIIRISAVLTIKNSNNTPQNVQAFVLVNGTQLFFPTIEASSISEDLGPLGPGSLAIPVLVEVGGPSALGPPPFATPLPIGVEVPIAIELTSSTDSGVTLSLEGSSIEIQEVAVATG